MRSRWYFVHWCVWNCSVCMTYEKQVQSIFFSLCSVNWEILKNKLACFIFKHSDMGKIFQVLTIVIRIKQIIPILIINLHIADSHFIICLSILLNPFKNIPQRSRDNTSLLILLFSSSDRVSLTRACLTICKNCAIVALKSLVDYFLGHCFEYSFLTWVSIKDCVEVIILVDGACVVDYVSFKIFLKLKSDFSIVSVDF